MKRKILATLALLVISVLPGCGKNNNGGISSGVYGAIPGNVNGCAPINAFNPGSVLVFQGQLESLTGVKSTMRLIGSGSYGGQYWRVNSLGDRVDVSVSGNTVTASVVISQNMYLTLGGGTGGYPYNNGGYGGGYGGNAICAAYMDVQTFATPVNGQYYQGNIGGGLIGLYTQTGQFISL